MQPAQRAAIIAFALTLAAATLHAQSLGDVAREQRQKQQAQGTHATKVVTNEDIPEHEETSSDTSASSNTTMASSAPSSTGNKKSADEWKSEILQQKNSVASLQDQIDKLNSSIRFAPPNCVVNCAQHNQQQIDKQEEVQRLQGQLDEQKKKLDELEEGARHDGYGGQVTDPQP
jgi:predicted RNase H-like nuclease (RuvC/YqgF family)